MTLATEIIGSLKQHMAETNKTIDDTMVDLICTKAVIRAIICMAEEEHKVEVANALYGVSSLLDVLHDKLGDQYRKDCKYLVDIGYGEELRNGGEGKGEL